MSNLSNKPLNIVLTIHRGSQRNSGAAGTVLSMKDEIERKGHRVTILSTDRLRLGRYQRYGYATMPVALLKWISAEWRERGIDVIDAETGDIWLWTLLAKRLRRRIPVLTRSHGLEHTAHFEQAREVKRGNMKLSWKYPLYLGGFRLFEVAQSMRLSDAVLLPNALEREFVIRKLGIPRSKAHLISYGLEDGFLSTLSECGPSQHDGKLLRIAWIGRYSQKRKGRDYATGPLTRVLNDYPHIRVTLLGTTEPIPDTLSCFDSDVRERIDVVPYFKNHELPRFLRDHGISLFPALQEGYGKGIIEGMAAGLATVTTNPAHIELVRNGENAIVIPKRNQNRIEEALRYLITNPTEIRRLGANAHNAVKHLSWNSVADERLAIYRKYIGGKQELLHSRTPEISATAH